MDLRKALGELDEVLLLDIYPARELPIPGVTADMVFEKIPQGKKEAGNLKRVYEGAS